MAAHAAPEPFRAKSRPWLALYKASAAASLGSGVRCLVFKKVGSRIRVSYVWGPGISVYSSQFRV